MTSAARGRGLLDALRIVLCAASVTIAFAGCAERIPAPTVSTPPADQGRRDLGPLVALGWIADRVGPRGDRVQPDGAVDFAFRVRVSGPVRAFLLVSSDARGVPCCGDIWDTLRTEAKLPEDLRLPKLPAAVTWSLAVYDASANLLNPDVTLPETTFHDEHLTLFAADPHRHGIAPGHSLTLLVLRPDGSVDRATTTLL